MEELGHFFARTLETVDCLVFVRLYSLANSDLQTLDGSLSKVEDLLGPTAFI